MKLSSRYSRARANARLARIKRQKAKASIVEPSIARRPLTNPLKGTVDDLAMAEVTVKGGGLFVGFGMKF